MRKQSFFDRIASAVGSNDEFSDYFDDSRPFGATDEMNPPYNEHYDEPPMPEAHAPSPSMSERPAEQPSAQSIHDLKDEGELAVDVYETSDEVVIKALVAGVMPNNIDIAVTRDMLTIQGTREDEREVEDDGYYRRELYWGGFSRTILLPTEVDSDGADAVEKHGILVVRLPKINKGKSTKLKVRTR